VSFFDSPQTFSLSKREKREIGQRKSKMQSDDKKRRRKERLFEIC
jgi:hypothetical protein